MAAAPVAAPSSAPRSERRASNRGSVPSPSPGSSPGRRIRAGRLTDGPQGVSCAGGPSPRRFTGRSVQKRHQVVALQPQLAAHPIQALDQLLHLVDPRASSHALRRSTAPAHIHAPLPTGLCASHGSPWCADGDQRCGRSATRFATLAAGRPCVWLGGLGPSAPARGRGGARRAGRRPRAGGPSEVPAVIACSVGQGRCGVDHWSERCDVPPGGPEDTHHGAPKRRVTRQERRKTPPLQRRARDTRGPTRPASPRRVSSKPNVGRSLRRRPTTRRRR